MLRDHRKNAAYFEAYISYQNERIAKKNEKLSACQNDKSKAERVRVSLLNYLIDLLFAEYSFGYDKSVLLLTLNNAIAIASEMNSLDYESLLNLLAISVFLENKHKTKELINVHKSFISSDKLLTCLASYLETNKIIWNGEFVIPKLYSELSDLDTSLDKESVLQKYLSTWYKKRDETSWYDSDKSDKDIYVGYWSFESAAIVQIFGISDSQLRENPYYPCL